MNYQEKAIELVEKFQSGYQSKEGFYYQFNNDNEEAKQCALIVVDEIIKVLTEYDELDYINSLPIGYWKLIKKEIEKL